MPSYLHGCTFSALHYTRVTSSTADEYNNNDLLTDHWGDGWKCLATFTLNTWAVVHYFL